MDLALLDGFVDLDTAARRMDLTKAQILELVRIHALRAVPIGFGEILVEPAILSR